MIAGGTNMVADGYSSMNVLAGEAIGTFLLCYVWASSFGVGSTQHEHLAGFNYCLAQPLRQ